MSVNCHVPNGGGYIFVVRAVLLYLIFIVPVFCCRWDFFLGDLFLLPGCLFANQFFLFCLLQFDPPIMLCGQAVSSPVNSECAG